MTANKKSKQNYICRQKYSFKLCPDTNSSSITNINFNPNKQYYMMSGHHNCIKFWDIRKSNIPVKIVEDHHSLLLSAKYNHAHD
jgi:WD40 repeat protein